MKILLAVDGSPYTKRMLTYLAAHQGTVLGPTFAHLGRSHGPDRCA